MGHSRRRWSFHCTHVKTRMLFQVPSPVSRESRWRKHWERESKEVEGTLHPVAAPILGRVVLHGTDSSLQCQTLQREFEVTSRAQAWQRQCRDWHGVGEVTALSGCAERSHSGSSVPSAGGTLSGCEAILPEVHNKLCPPKRSDCTAQQLLTTSGLSQNPLTLVGGDSLALAFRCCCVTELTFPRSLGVLVLCW